MERFRPLPQLTGDNYAYWKARTRTHLKAQGDQVWRAVLTGTSSVKQSKLQLVKTEFEGLRMNEDEDIASFHERIQEMKVTAIQELDGWENKSVAQLMGNLRTYEMEILTDHTKKKKTVAFVAEEQDDTANPDESGDDPVEFLTEQFSNFLKQVSQKNSQNKKFQKGASSNMSKTCTKTGMSNSKTAAPRPARSKEKSNNKGIKCYECEGFGHVQAECPTYLRRKKSMTATTWSDDEPESEAAHSDAEEMFANFVAFTARGETCSEPGDASDTEGGEYNSAEDLEIPDLSYEVEFNKLYLKWEALLKANRVVSSEVRVLFGIGFTGGTNKDKTTFVKTYDPRPEDTPESSTTKQYRESAPAIGSARQTRGYEDTSDLSVITSTKNKGSKNIAISRDEKWYFDSGCSRHMTGNATFLSDINTSNGEVTFGDGVK
ncbi:PREDICTED: uncharacterized protein LOC109181216 [Ipomoea nil]|uniref:uncharacterized protein LOC109181216 n=1 Tax=Ipomoea nil TaxID=35883 RepID=UPI000900EED9|nr:PREDICTED: uncharacterized protein LOC109181216 [Ipomoea nil]